MNSGIFDHVEKIADAVMYEGYVLYPYRASAMKNRFRWQFGIVAPREGDQGTCTDPWYAQTECLVEPGPAARLMVKIRCLQLQHRLVEERRNGDWFACDRLVANGRELLTWDEAVPQAVASSAIPLDRVCAHGHEMALDLDGALEHEYAFGADHEPIARITRQRRPLSAVVRLAATRAGGLVKVRVRVENTTVHRSATPDRAAALRRCLVGCHTLLHVADAQFVSLMDPPLHARDAVKDCRNEHTWPVLAGAHGRRDVMLSSPIILYDFPSVAPESAHSFFDATEIDEMLALRVMTLTNRERQEAAATDDHAAAILDRVGLDAGLLTTLHGAVRPFEDLLNGSAPPPEHASVTIGSACLAAGSKVRLEPRRRADSMDMFLAGRIATIAMVHRDLEDRVYLAVTLDDDPAADLQRAYGRFFYFSPEEVRSLDWEGAADDAR